MPEAPERDLREAHTGDREVDLKHLSFIRINSYGMTLFLRSLILPGLLLVLFMFSAGCMQAPEPAPVAAKIATESSSPAVTAAVPQNATKEEMVSFVQEAVDYAHRNGREKALAEFSSRNGSFFRGVLYIYAYDYNGTTIAHPVNPEKIGVNRLNEKDAEGNLFIRDLREAAYNGSGFATYTYINPVHNNAVEKKLGYVMKVDDSWWLGSGIYSGPVDAPAPSAPVQTTPSVSLRNSG
jgi:cytochrome c